MREATESAFRNVLETMAGADGGLRFIRYQEMLRHYDSLAAKGNLTAKQVISVLICFSNLIDVANDPEAVIQ